jgi:hypothetical protein
MDIKITEELGEICLRSGGGDFEYGNAPSFFIKGDTFLDQLNDL